MKLSHFNEMCVKFKDSSILIKTMFSDFFKNFDKFLYEVKGIISAFDCKIY
jgi:hypothetical protein